MVAKPADLVKNIAKEIVREEDPDGWRWYIGPDGRKYASVTNVLSVAVHERLQNWFKKTGPKAIEKRGGKARALGSADHEALEVWVNEGRVVQGREDLIQCWSGLALEEGIVPERAEIMMYSPTLGVAGTADIVGTIKGEPTIMDLKTGRTFSVKTGWQLALYKFMWEEHTQMIGTRIAGIHARRIESQTKILQPTEEDFEIRLFKYEHMDWCLHRALSCLEVWKGLYFSKLQKMEWPWLHEYSAHEQFRKETNGTYV